MTKRQGALGFQRLLWVGLWLFSTLPLGAAKVEVTQSNFKQVTSRRPVIAFLSLGCDMGDSFSGQFFEALEDLQGVDLSVIDVNSAYQIIGRSKPYDLGGLVLLSNGEILDSDISFYDNQKYMARGYNGQKRWAVEVLKKHKIPFQHPTVLPDRADPYPSTGAVDLQRGLFSSYSFEGDPKDATGKLPDFNLSGDAKVAGGVLVSTARYDGKNGAGAYHNWGSPSPYSQGFTAHANIRLNPLMVKDDMSHRRMLFTIADRVLALESFHERISLNLSLYRKNPEGSEPAYSYSDDLYALTEAQIVPEKWHSISLSVNLDTRRISIVFDGKQLQDINLSDKALLFYKNHFDSQGTGINFYNFGWGGVLDGMADNAILYSRPLSGAELLALDGKYSKTAAAAPVALPDPRNEARLKEWGLKLIRASYSGDVESAQEALGQGAPVDFPNQGWTPLLYAAYYGHTSVVELLIKNHANALLGAGGWTPLMLAQNQKHAQAAALLEDYTNTERFYAGKSVVKPKAIPKSPPRLN